MARQILKAKGEYWPTHSSSLSEQLGTGILCKIKLEELHILQANHQRKGYKLKRVETAGYEFRKGENPLTAINFILELKRWLTDISESLGQLITSLPCNFAISHQKWFYRGAKLEPPSFYTQKSFLGLYSVPSILIQKFGF